ncbi:MAG: cysteine synthase A [Bacilli bacterium]|nr:cysteine synthase A [Bacilli bacterium]
MRIHENILSTIGNTPIVRLRKIEALHSLDVRLYAKIESFNPGGSVKDRIALNMIVTAEKQGLLVPGATIVEPTSGNTGIGLAMVGAVKGYRVILVMPDSASLERRKLMRAYGAELVLTEGAKGITESVNVAINIAKDIPGAFVPYQFENPANPETHILNTAREIIEVFPEGVHAFVAGIGTGGTITGVGRFFKERKQDVHIVAVEPADSPVLTEGRKGPHKIQGIGAGFIPSTLDTSIYDEVVTVTNEEAYENTRLLARQEGILAGISSGAALTAALKIAKRDRFKDKNILIIFPDTGERYLSTELY